MKVSLRKAKVLQTSIQDLIKEININTTIELNEFQDVNSELTKATIQLETNAVRYANLLSAQYAIRSAVGKANSDAGIDTALTATAMIGKSLEFKTQLSKAASRLDDIVLKGKIERLRRASSDSHYLDSVTAPILSEKQIAVYKSDVVALKKKQQQLADSILELNIRTEITLSDDVVTVLKAEGLI
ncbi:hypothetical protein UFOVP116_104 [uncultured Caudovirales phage]|uniref:Uncharacterized protein n=1 Tax=uncultured Caudovirales phage TaxID=2100421 RepID=A0A6J5L5Z8_9CAUD|nr:hypothetical protein UFOVP116_104 [uncultured Caudovirales phage]